MVSSTGTDGAALAEAYLSIKQIVFDAGFISEVEWQATRSLDNLSESEFLQELAWVVVCSGMREAVVRRLFPRLSLAFKHWESAGVIVGDRDNCRTEGLSVFNHRAKIEAILSACERVEAMGFLAIMEAIKDGGVGILMQFDFIGPVTCYHLAKNIGLQVVKPDRHLVRIAKAAGFCQPFELCNMISKATGDKITVVDLVLWRFATLRPNYLCMFESNHALFRSQPVPFAFS